ncbi:hypothetical protein [Gordonia sp. NPDC003376]
MSDSMRLVTRENFYEVGKWAGVEEYWGLHAPRPALHIETPDGLALAHIGDTVACFGDDFYVLKAAP